MSVPTPVLSTRMQSHPGSHFGPTESLQVYQHGFRGDESERTGDMKEAVLGLERVKYWGM